MFAGGVLPKNLIEELEDLRLMLDKAQVERWTWFKHNSDHGEDCAYAMKAKDLFERFHADEIEKKINHIYNTFYKGR